MWNSVPERKNMMIKKISAIIAAAVLAATMLASCGSSSSSDAAADSSSASQSGSGTEADSKADNSSSDDSAASKPSLTIDGQTVDTTDLVMCTVDGEEIKFDRFRYYYYYVIAMFENSYGISRDNIVSDEEASKAFKESLKNLIVGDMATSYLAKENNITLSDEDISSVDKEIDNIKSQYDSEESFYAALETAHLTFDAFREMQQLSALYNKVKAVYETSAEDFKKIVADTDRYSRIVHILVPYYCKAEISDESTASEYESYSLYQKGEAKKKAFNALSEEDQNKLKEEAKKLADEVLEKAKNGDDFTKLISEFGWDPGMEVSPQGYYIDKENNSFVKDFVDAAFAIEENQISDLVESTSFGWFILKRLPVDMDYVDKNIDSMLETFNKPTLSKVFNEAAEKVEFVGGEYYDKIDAKSIT